MVFEEAYDGEFYIIDAAQEKHFDAIDRDDCCLTYYRGYEGAFMRLLETLFHDNVAGQKVFDITLKHHYGHIIFEATLKTAEKKGATYRRALKSYSEHFNFDSAFVYSHAHEVRDIEILLDCEARVIINYIFALKTMHGAVVNISIELNSGKYSQKDVTGLRDFIAEYFCELSKELSESVKQIRIMSEWLADNYMLASDDISIDFTETMQKTIRAFTGVNFKKWDEFSRDIVSEIIAMRVKNIEQIQSYIRTKQIDYDKKG